MFPILFRKVLSIITLYFGIGVVSMIETWCSYGIGLVSTSYYPISSSLAWDQSYPVSASVLKLKTGPADL